MWVTNNNKERGFETEGRGSGCGQNGEQMSFSKAQE